MPVVISPNIKKEKVQIDAGGNIVKPFTHEVISVAEPDPIQEVPQPKEEKPTQKSDKKAKTDNPLAEIIRKQVQDAVKNAMKDIDISKMVSESISEAFK